VNKDYEKKDAGEEFKNLKKPKVPVDNRNILEKANGKLENFKSNTKEI
jgi:hypothetical protein